MASQSRNTLPGRIALVARWIGLVAVGCILASSSVSLALSSGAPCDSDADCPPNAECVTSNISGSSQCVTSNNLLDPTPAGSPILDQSYLSNLGCPPGYRCAGLAVGRCAIDPTSFCSYDSDCPTGACVGSCFDSTVHCRTDADCAAGTCSPVLSLPGTGLCVSQTSCNGSSACPSGFTCTFQPQPGRCELAPTKCASDSDCLADWHCHLSWAAPRVITGECLPGN